MDASSKTGSSPTISSTPMPTPARGRVAIVFPGDRAARASPAPGQERFAKVFEALAAIGLAVEPAAYDDDFCAEVKQQLLGVDAVLVWVNPIEGERDRTVLDAMLREVAAAGVFVSSHPVVILKLGTKEVLYQTRMLGWGCDTHVYRSLAQMRSELPARLATGEARVLKQYRGNGGNGVWKVALANPGRNEAGGASMSADDLPVLVRHAKRGCVEEKLPLGAFLRRCEAYFSGAGRMIDQAWQPRLPEGMVRCYLVHDKVAGFGHQAINALYPAPAGAAPQAAPAPGPRLYHPPSMPQFQRLKRLLEDDWVPALEKLLEIERVQLPVIWDCDFMFGPKDAAGEDSYVLCEINVSSVSPFPDSALAPLAQATATAIAEAKREK